MIQLRLTADSVNCRKRIDREMLTISLILMNYLREQDLIRVKKTRLSLRLSHKNEVRSTAAVTKVKFCIIVHQMYTYRIF